MCVIAYYPADLELNEKELNHCFDRNPDGVLPDEIRKAFGSASIGPSLVVDGINNTTITLYY